MSLLNRYRRKGGVAQLLNLLESSAPAKREQLFTVISQEDPSWAALLRVKILTVEKVLKWNSTILTEIVGGLPPRTVGTLLHSLDETQRETLRRSVPTTMRVEVEREFKMLTPSAAELEVSRVKFIAKIRELERDQQLNLGQIDPQLRTDEIRAS